jgi:hypothetical protein
MEHAMNTEKEKSQGQGKERSKDHKDSSSAADRLKKKVAERRSVHKTKK